MFERSWSLYISGEKDRALPLFERAMKAAEHAAGAPEGDRRMRVDPPAWIESFVVGDRVLVPTPFLLLVAEPTTGRAERVVRGSLHSPQVIRGTSLVIERKGPAGTQLIDGKTLEPVVSWDGWTLARPSADGTLLAVEVSLPGEGTDRDLKKIVVFDTRERREIVQIPVPELLDVRIVDAGRILVNGGEVRETRSGRLLFSQSNVLGSPAFARSYVAFVASDGGVVLAERDSWKPISKTRACAKAEALAFDPSGTTLAIGGADGACLLDVPSLKARRSFVARTLPVVQHPELETPRRNRTIPTFLENGRVLSLESSETNEVSLFDPSTGRLLSHDVGKRANPSPEDAPPRDVLDRIRANLCILDWGGIDWGRGTPPERGFWMVPREACHR